MLWTTELRGKPVSFSRVEGAVAVRPAEDLVERSTSRARMTRVFGSPADDAGGGRFGLALPARDRKAFERAGWLFAEPSEAVARAARARTAVEAARAVQPAYLDRAGSLQVATDLVTAQLPPDVTVPDREVAAYLRQDGLRLVRHLPFAPRAVEARLPARKPLAEAVAELQARRDRYRFVEPVFLQVLGGRRTPTDPQFGRQRQHANDGSNGGTAGADLRSEAAWDAATGRGPDRAVRVAVIDNGMQVGHPDLRPGLVGGGHFEEDYGGGVTFVPRAAQSNFPSGNHGTFCMGMAGARWDNGRGGRGSAPEAELTPVACLPDRVGTQTTLARAVAFAADPSREVPTAPAGAGADVVVCSLGPNGADWLLTSVLDLAVRFAAGQGRGGLGVPLFWAVSNGPVEAARDEVCSHEDVIAVGRSNRNDEEDGSAYGPKLEFLAPGVEVYSTRSGGQYGTGTGTSYAAPLAAGVGALVLARYPNWTRQQVRDRLRAACDKVGGVQYDSDGRHPHYGHGRLNAERAVQ